MKIIRELLGWAVTIVLAFGIASIINIFVFQPTRVEGQSMEPTLHNKDKVFMSKLIHTLKGEPEYGDIVIIDSRVDRPRSIKDDLVENFKYNIIVTLLTKNTDEIYWIKRVIGKAGDTLEFRDGKVFRNGRELKEPYVKEAMDYSSKEKVVVPKNRVFVMGDNRNHSSDSRFIGSIPKDHIIGKLVFKF